jgi:hypothetical protein
MTFFLPILKTLWAMHPPRFWMIWYTGTTAALIYVMSVVGEVATPRCQKTRRPWLSVVSTRVQTWNFRDIVALTLLAGFLASYVATILVWEDFAYYDNDDFMLFTLKGHNFSPPIWPQNGRFFPFGLIEFNLIRHFTNTPAGYQLFPIAEILSFFCILLVLDIELDITARIGLAILALLTPSILLSFGGLIFEERNVLLCIALLTLSIGRFDRTKGPPWAILAVLSAQIMLYFKETAFLLILGFAAARLILRCRNGQHERWDYKRLWEQESRLDLCLAGLAMLFLVSYFAVMGLHGNTNYATGAAYPMSEVVRAYLRLDLLVWLFIAVLMSRVYLILRHRTSPWLLWDGLAVGGAAFFLGYLSLRMCTAYYLAPVDLIALLYVGRIVVLSWKQMLSGSKMGVLMAALVILFQDVSLSAFALFERKNLIHGKVEVASVVRHLSDSPRTPSLFFPFTKPYEIMEFIAYLNYRGVPIRGAALPGAATEKDAPCVAYRTIICHPASRPSPGDLVIVLPDDKASLAQAAAYRERGELVFSYEPRPSIARWLYSFVSAPLATDDHKARPDRWMDASVTVWRK